MNVSRSNYNVYGHFRSNTWNSNFEEEGVKSTREVRYGY
jgi:hypothetical protein